MGRAFVIGGASIYEQAIGMEECERALCTRIGKAFECDTWFPKGVLDEEGQVEGSGRWRKKSKEDLEEWSGEAGIGGVKMEGDVKFEVEMWENERGRGIQGG